MSVSPMGGGDLDGWISVDSYYYYIAQLQVHWAQQSTASSPTIMSSGSSPLPGVRQKVIGLVSGGKDSCFNLVHCAANGHELVAIATLQPEAGIGACDLYNPADGR
jgi:hypothetical protein